MIKGILYYHKSIILSISLFTSSCISYDVSIDTLTKEFSGIDSSQMKKVEYREYYGVSYSYLANPAISLRCLGKNNESVLIDTKASQVLKITKKDNNKTCFYLDGIVIRDSAIYGTKSRLNPKIESVSLKNIKSFKILDSNGTESNAYY